MAKMVKPGKDLKTLDREFRAWRRRRKRGARIPEPLWARAVATVSVHGLWRTAKYLRLDYAVLKRRCEAVPSGAAEFVELPVAIDRGPECLLELADQRGTTLRVGLRGAGVQQLEVATRLLWRLSR